MAVGVDSASAYYRTPATPQPGATGTFAIWIKPAGWASGSGHHLLPVSWGTYDSGDYNIFGFQRYTDNNVYLGYEGSAGHGGDQRLILSDVGLFSDGVWCHNLFTWDDAANDQRYYVNGVEKGSRVTALVSQTLIGSHTFGGSWEGLPINDLGSYYAEFGQWNRVLTVGERATLAAGFSPRCLPRGLIAFVPLVRNTTTVQDYVGGRVYSATGIPTYQAHPRVFYPFSSRPITARIVSQAGQAYNTYKKELLSGATDTDSGDVRALLVLNTYAFDADHATLSAIASHFATADRIALSGRTVAVDHGTNRANLTANDITFTNVAASQAVGGMLVYRHVSAVDDAQNIPLLYYPLILAATTGSNVVVACPTWLSLALGQRTYNAWRGMLLDGTAGLLSATYKAMLVTTGYTFNPDETSLTTAAASEALMAGETTRIILANRVVDQSDVMNLGLFSADDPVFSSVTTGQNIAGIVVYQDNGADSANVPAFFLAFSWTSDGGDLEVDLLTITDGGALTAGTF
jgi:hypothetical protein